MICGLTGGWKIKFSFLINSRKNRSDLNRKSGISKISFFCGGKDLNDT